MKKFALILLAFGLTVTVCAQDSASYYTAFHNLIGSEWQGSGKWTDGSPFRHEVVFSSSLDGKLIRAQTFSAESTGGSALSLRNDGIRAWDAAQSKMRFWEFDIHGGITEGYCTVEGTDIYYHYDYDPGGGIMKLTDGWIQKDKDTYQYRVGVFEDGKWTKLFLDGMMRRK